MKTQTHWHQKLGIGTLALTLSLGAGIANAQNLITDGNAESGTTQNWLRITGTSDDAHSGNHSFAINGHTNIMSKQILTIDPDKTYTLSGWFKSTSEKPSKIYFGLAPLDENKKPITSWLVNAVSGSETTLTEACTPKDTVLKVADASKWMVHKHAVVAFDISPDFKDLPNRHMSPFGITALENKGDHWEVTLKKPCNQTMPAGTPVRVQRAGSGYMYSGASNKIVPDEWTQFTGKIKGIALKGLPYKQFWAGTRYARILILANYNMKKDGVLLVDDLTLTAK